MLPAVIPGELNAGWVWIFLAPKIRCQSPETTQIQILESVDHSEVRLKGDKHVKVLALYLLLSEYSKLSPILCNFNQQTGCSRAKLLHLPSCSHFVALKVERVTICAESQQPPSGNISYRCVFPLLGTEFALEPYIWNAKEE